MNVTGPLDRIKDAKHEAARFRARAIAGFLLIFACLTVLALRFAYLDIARHEEFSARSDQNRISVRRLAPTRGLIFDRNGALLAENVAAFRLEVVPDKVKDLARTLADLGTVVPLSDDDIEHFNALRKSKHAFESIPLRFKLSEDEIARFSTERWRFPGVDIVPYLTRSYPRGEEFAHLVGYVGRIDEADAEKLDVERYAGTTHIGKSGIERSYEDALHGEPGYVLEEVNVDKRPLREIRRVPPTPGKNLYLTIDARLQHVAEEAFEGRAGSAVAIDPRNGEVLAMVSVPSFDPNLFVNGIGRVDYSTLLNAPERPLLNRAIAGGYTPGSTVKPYLALGGLELGLRRPEDTVYSTGEFFIPGQSRGYRDDKKGGHGRVDLVQAIAQSVNTYFYSLALDMGVDRFSTWMGKFGFGKPTGIDLFGESSGVLPSKEWKRGRYNQPFYPGETVIAGIGQGYWVITPIQLAQAVSILANRGVRHVPHLLRAVQDGITAPPVPVPLAPASPSIIHNAANWTPVEQGMIAVINGGGTANGLGQGFPYVIAGKTGTAERYSRTGDTWENIMEVSVERHEVLFEAFTPADDARIAVIVALEAGHTGAHDAAPIARKILDAWVKDDDVLTAGAAR
ncbi:MAG TPA: penicillin-binding protein 2 [Rudaea sp.]|nr:penicillin-binding protein 2 [Rudaea sp.]